MLLGTYEVASSSFDIRRREGTELRRVALLSKLDEEALALIESHASVRSLPKGMNLIHAGERCDALYVIFGGRVKLFLANEDGKEIVLGTLEAGECFGEVALLDDTTMAASVATLEVTRVALIPGEVLREIAQHDAQFALHLAQRLARQVRQLSEQVKSLGLCSVYQRLARTLCSMAQPSNTAQPANGTQPYTGAQCNAAQSEAAHLVINHRFTHQELAKRIGASREMVTRIFRDLVVGGYLRVDGRRVVIAKKLPASW